jgi:hypothetical protein
MEISQQTQQRPLIAKLWPFLFLIIGLSRLADWAYGGRHDWGSLLSGLGFLLMAPGARSIGVPKTEPAVSAHARLFLALTIAGAALIIAAIGKRWM